jgi:tetratricopeptide (TPR) repeat protein
MWPADTKKFFLITFFLFLLSLVLFQQVHADIQVKIKNGIEALQKNQFHAAVDHFQAAVNENPASEEAIFYLGLSLEKSGYTNNAVETYRHLMKLKIADEWQKKGLERLMPLEEQLAEKNYNRALSLYNKGNLPMALTFCKECVKNYPNTQKGRLAAELHEKCGLLLIAKKMTKYIQKNGLQKVAVIDFTEKSNIPCKRGQLLSENFITQLESLGFLTVIKREAMQKVINEQELSIKHLLDTGKATTLGKIVEADVIVVGKTGEDLRLTATNVMNGENISTHFLELLRKEKDLTLQASVLENLKSIEGCNGNLKVKIWMDKGENAVYHIGDKTKVLFRASDNCYVTVFIIQTCGDISVLYPNRSHPDNLLFAGKTYSVPDEDNSHEITVCPPAGIETIKIIATTSQTPLFDLTFSGNDIYAEISAGEEAVKAAQNVSEIIKKMPPHLWAEAHMNFEIRK